MAQGGISLSCMNTSRRENACLLTALPIGILRREELAFDGVHHSGQDEPDGDHERGFWICIRFKVLNIVFTCMS